jgi:EAL domain-containing protein (putative c-di-GMP-specific phosphodiesterase class I)
LDLDSFILQPIYYVKSGKPLFYEVLYRGTIPNNVLFYRTNEVLDMYLFSKAINYINLLNNSRLYTVNLSSSSLVKYAEKFQDLLKNRHNVYIELLERDIDFYDSIDSGFNRKVILDDFGSVYSNFDRILKFKPFAIKFDKVMIQFNIKLLSSLREEFEQRGIVCVFEKIENTEEYKKVNEAGFVFMQGFYLNNMFNN